MVAPVVLLRANPHFYPITPDGSPNLDWLEQNCGEAAALLVPHYFGVPRDLAVIRAFCDVRGIALIEDCAHTFFGLAGDRPVGMWGDAVIASLPKFFPGPDGGLLVVRSDGAKPVTLRARSVVAEVRAWLDMLEISASHSGLGPLNPLFAGLFWLKDLIRRNTAGKGVVPITSKGGAMTEYLDESLVSLRASAAARWAIRTSDLERLAIRRRHNYQLIVNSLAGASGVKTLLPTIPKGAVPYVCPVVVENPDFVYHKLREDGMPVFRWDILWPGTPVISGDAGAEWSRNLLQVGCHQDLSDDDIRLIAKRIASYGAGL